MEQFFSELDVYFESLYRFEEHWLHYFFVMLPIIILCMFIRDVTNKRQTIKHNFPVVGRLRYLLESIGPELRQYIVASNREELPFNRSERSWIYASSKRQNNYEGFGTDKDIYAPGHIFINSALFPFTPDQSHPNTKDPYFLPCAKVMGLYNKRKRPFRPYSLINISAMSYGALSKNAVTALNKGALTSGCYHSTGEGSLSPYHAHGADVMFHFGTGYFGVRTPDGKFSMEKMVELTQKNPFVRAIEIKLSQGAKPGKGGILPAKKITPEIAEIRGVPLGKDAISPSSHLAFSTVPEMLDFIEDIAENTGLPVGFKAAVGKMELWEELADEMVKRNTGPDFITIDGGEGGTGAAPHSFADHMALPFMFAFTNVYKIFRERDLTDRVVFVASGRLGFPAKTLMAMSLGVDLIQVAREAMISIGCIQAQTCHRNNCPTGIATQNKWLMSGLDPDHKADRFHNYVTAYRKEVLEMTRACGYEHPAQIRMSDIEVGMGEAHTTQTLADNFGYVKKELEFGGMQSLLDCQYLGGLGQSAPVKKV